MRYLLDGDETDINKVLQFIQDSDLAVKATPTGSGYDRPSELNRAIRRNIRRLREEKDLSRTQLAEMSGVRSTLLSNVESGHRILNDWEIRCIADALGVTVNELVT